MKLDQVMYKNRNITDFFKPFTQPPSSKRSREDDGLEDLPVLGRPRSKSPRTQGSASAAHGFSDVFSHHTTSSLTSLDSDLISEDGYLARVNTRCEPCGPSNIAALDSNSSQGPILTSSQRVIQNGEVLIRNSDDESASDMSLGDLDDLLNRSKPTPTSSPPTESDLPLPDSSTLGQPHKSTKAGWTRNGGLKPKAGVPKPLPVIPKYRFSLDSLVAQAEKDEAAEAGARQARILAEELDEQRAARNVKDCQTWESKGNVDEGLLASMVDTKGDGEIFDRLVHAIQRTEALHQEKSWSFFDPTETSHFYNLREFPQFGLKCRWQKVMNERLDRERAFLDGYVGEIASKGKLPDKIVAWIIDATCAETRENLRDAYISTVVDAADQVTSLMTPCRIDLLFRQLGAYDEALDLNRSVVAVVHPPSKGDGPISCHLRLLSVLELLAETAGCLSTDARTHALCLLCRLSLDASTMNDSSVMVAAEHALARLVDAIPADDFEHEALVILSTIYPQVSDAELRLQLLRSIPSSTTRLNLLRRRLSLAFFFEDSTFLMAQSLGFSLLSASTKHLQEPQFLIRHNTDYSELAASIGILDIGVGDGVLPFSTVLAEDESEFNKDIDKLAKTIKGMFTRIIDTGASHMLRTEAKDVLEALHSRLTFAARTNPKPKRNLFVNSKQELVRGGGSGYSMKNFWPSKGGIKK